MEEKAGWSSIFMKTTYVIIIEINQMMCSLNYLDFICLYSIFSVIGKREEIFGPFWICWTKIDITDLHHPENCYLFKVNNRNIRKVYEICSKFITSFWCHNCQLWIYFAPLFTVCIIEFEHLFAWWVIFFQLM